MTTEELAKRYGIIVEYETAISIYFVWPPAGQYRGIGDDDAADELRRDPFAGNHYAYGRRELRRMVIAYVFDVCCASFGITAEQADHVIEVMVYYKKSQSGVPMERVLEVCLTGHAAELCLLIDLVIDGDERARR